ncbi:ATP-binding protein [archaeon]|nr:ATP-binding protein [archaeon]
MRFNPFNPELPAKPAFFVGRKNEINQFEKYLYQTMNSSPMNFAVVGNRGMGKTSLLAKFENIAKNKNCLVVRISNYEGQVKHIRDLSEFILLNIRKTIFSEKPLDKIKENIKKFFLSLEFVFDVGDTSIKISKKDVILSGLFREKLEEIWNKLKEEYSAIVILIDEAESIEKIEGSLMFLREVFSRLGENLNNYMLVLSGKLNFPEKMAEAFSPLNRFFPSLKLSGLNEDEMSEFINLKLKLTNVSVEPKIIHALSRSSEGHPFVLVSMAYNLFDCLNDEADCLSYETYKKNNLKLLYSLDEFFSSLYSPLTPKAKGILFNIASNLRSGKKDFLFSDVQKWTKIGRSGVSPYISEMVRKACINRLSRGEYEIFHKLYIPYILRKNEGERIILSKDKLGDEKVALSNYF